MNPYIKSLGSMGIMSGSKEKPCTDTLLLPTSNMLSVGSSMKKGDITKEISHKSGEMAEGLCFFPPEVDFQKIGMDHLFYSPTPQHELHEMSEKEYHGLLW